MLKIENLSKIYRSGKKENAALDCVNLDVAQGETVALLGDSGSGKSTLGQIVCGLLKQTFGKVYFDNCILEYPIQKKFRKDIQILFQHPEVSFNPRLKIYDSIKEPYELYCMGADRNKIIKDIERFGLREEHLDRYPRELSGGELQRLSLSRILAVEPRLIVLDEPTSMLDVVSQAQILYYLKEYQREHSTAYIFITHHNLLAEKFADRIVRIENGKIENIKG